jgi:CDP-diacylglycerol pyrophosphatase
MLRTTLALLVGVFLFLPKLGQDVQRSVLWHVVQACVANHDLTGLAFPCLQVDATGGPDRGYAVLRAPFVKSHTIVTPIVQTVGIEASRLRGPDAPNYFADAWAARHFATRGLKRLPDRADFALAVNSRAGRSQDQLHIHVDCIRPKVSEALARDASDIGSGRWTSVKPLPASPRYWAKGVQSDALAGINVFDLVADGLHVAPADMDPITIVVVGSDDIAGKPGFVVLARKRLTHVFDEAHGEALMDHSCPAFR